MNEIRIRGAKEHNLQNISLTLPREKFIVISGMSGSGKSSLAFSTIFAEGQRRFMESLSAYIRQFLGKMHKPDVESIEGLSPAIAIEQKTTHNSPRSTVGTITEIYDYMRLLFARIGEPVCPNGHGPITSQSVDQIVDKIFEQPEGARLMLMAPLVSKSKGTQVKVIKDAKELGYQRARIDGEVILLDEAPALEKNKKHTIDLVVDRLVLSQSETKHLSDSIELAQNLSGKGIIVQNPDTGEEHFYSTTMACPVCGYSFPEVRPQLFSFNSPMGACPSCSGLGKKMDFSIDLLIPDKTLSINQHAILPYNPSAHYTFSLIEALAQTYDFSLDAPFSELPSDIQQLILYGAESPIVVKTASGSSMRRRFTGLIPEMRRRYKESLNSLRHRLWFESFMIEEACEACHGKRLSPAALSVLIKERSIYDVTTLSVRRLIEFIGELTLTETQKIVAKDILKEIENRLSFLSEVGLPYLALNRTAGTLSGGEMQRIRLATQIGSQLTGVLYVLDEPTIGLHERDNQKLINTLKKMRDLGNTIIVVEHDEQVIRQADWVVDMGPAAGIHGGKIIAEGTPVQIEKNPKSLTGQYLSGEKSIAVPEKLRKGNGYFIEIKGATEHNLKNLDIKIPLGMMVLITGVSGSGKSTVLNAILAPALLNEMARKKIHQEGAYKSITGAHEIDRVIRIDQSPIGRTPRSNPATYVKLFDHIRALYTAMPLSKERGYNPGRFSFNVKNSGRCETCQGAGVKKIEMQFLPDVYVTCDVCHGKRFNRDTLDVTYKDKNIYDVLQMSVEEAVDFFSAIPPIAQRLRALLEVGLGYVTLGQSALVLSGGEAQRVKLALELSKKSTGRTFYLIDEPTTGLHMADIKMLLAVLHSLVDKGNTICMIEHNMDVIKQADYIIDLGPEGGEGGGEIVIQGSPAHVAACTKSQTGRYLKNYLPAKPR